MRTYQHNIYLKNVENFLKKKTQRLDASSIQNYNNKQMHVSINYKN